MVRCDARKYDWPALAHSLLASSGKVGDWALLLQKEEFILLRNRQTSSEAFLFPYGVTVLWTTQKEQQWPSSLVVLQKPIGPHEAVMEEWMFSSAESDSILVDEITLDQTVHPLAAKLAASTGLAQELKLTFFEEQVERAIALIESIPEQMAASGQLTFSRKQINRKYGELMMVRTSINLHSDVLDLPGFFYDLPEGQNTYNVVARYLQIARRARILNDRLDLLQDVYMMLSDDRSKNVSHRLEWIIIVLIAAEIVLLLPAAIAA